jgi:hypothetical protein
VRRGVAHGVDGEAQAPDALGDPGLVEGGVPQDQAGPGDRPREVRPGRVDGHTKLGGAPGDGLLVKALGQHKAQVEAGIAGARRRQRPKLAVQRLQQRRPTTSVHPTHPPQVRLELAGVDQLGQHLLARRRRLEIEQALRLRGQADQRRRRHEIS